MEKEVLARTYHFICMDIVGFSKRGISAANQVKKIQKLNDVVRNAQAFVSAKRRKQTVGNVSDLPHDDQPVLTADSRTEWALWQLSVIMAEIAEQAIRSKNDQ